jgi:hypothetical protein
MKVKRVDWNRDDFVRSNWTVYCLRGIIPALCCTSCFLEFVRVIRLLLQWNPLNEAINPMNMLISLFKESRTIRKQTWERGKKSDVYILITNFHIYVYVREPSTKSHDSKGNASPRLCRSIRALLYWSEPKKKLLLQDELDCSSVKG